MNLRKALLLSSALLEHFLNNYDSGMGPLFHPGRYLYGSFEDCTDRHTLQKNLSGLVAAGLLKKKRDRDQYYLTPLGWEKVAKFLPLKETLKKPWDGLWRVVVYDIAEERRVERNFLRRRLKELGFRLWQKSTWLTPHDVSLELYRLLKGHSLVGRVSVFEARNLFGLDNRRLAARTWPLTELGKKYHELTEAWQAGKGKAGQDRNKLKELSRKFQERYLELLQKDPQLPSELLPKDWPSRKLKTIMTQTISYLAA